MLNFMFIDRLLFELSCKNMETRKPRNRETRKNTQTLWKCPTGEKVAEQTIFLLVFTLQTLNISMKFNHSDPVEQNRRNFRAN